MASGRNSDEQSWLPPGALTLGARFLSGCEKTQVNHGHDRLRTHNTSEKQGLVSEGGLGEAGVLGRTAERGTRWRPPPGVCGPLLNARLLVHLQHPSKVNIVALKANLGNSR